MLTILVPLPLELERLADRAPPGRQAAVRNEALRLVRDACNGLYDRLVGLLLVDRRVVLGSSLAVSGRRRDGARPEPDVARRAC